jgi:nucleoside-diphosphate-sugar epimerase
MTPERILITGGCGFLGQYLTSDLLEALPGVKIKILDLKHNPNSIFDFNANPNVRIVTGKDIRDFDEIVNDFRDIDLVIHLAGLVSFSIKDRKLLNDINVLGTRNVLKAAVENKVRNFIHISSVTALGYNDDPNEPIDEDFQFDFSIAEKRKKFYMLSKHQADIEVKKHANQGLNAIIFYPGLMLGPGDTINSAKLVNAINSHKIPFNMPGGTNVIDVRDVSNGIVAAITKDICKGDFLLSGWNLTFTDINKTIALALAVFAPRKTLPRFLNPVLFKFLQLIETLSKNKLELTADNLDSAFKFRYFDNSRAKNTLDWSPQITFWETVNDIIEWMNKNEHIKG